MQPFLDQGSPEAQAAAVTYLGANPNYQQVVRDQYLFNPSMPDKVKAAAASSLGQYDPNFSSYATVLIANPELAPEVYTQVVEGYLAQSRDKLQPAQLRALKQAVENYREFKPETDLSIIQRQLDAILPD
jgi:hypothetical protein